MELTPFELDRWLAHKYSVSPKVEYDLASSTGPRWTLAELLRLSSDSESKRDNLLQTALSYCAGEGGNSLRQAIADYQHVSLDDIQVTTGASEALMILFAIAAQPDGNVIIPSPNFPSTEELPRLFGLETRFYYLRPENKFRIDVEEIKKLADDRTQIILVNSPHNPTGSVLSFEDMTQLHDFCAERNIRFVVDEVYHPVYHAQEMPSAATLPKATVIGSLSKSFCLSGLRTGWIVERDRNRVEKYFDARAYFTISSAALSEAMAILALGHREKIFEQVKRVAAANLKHLVSFFDAHAEVLSWVRPPGGLTIFPWLNSRSDARVFCQQALKHGVLIVPGDCFGMPSHFRLGYGTLREQNFKKALERLSDAVKAEWQ